MRAPGRLASDVCSARSRWRRSTASACRWAMRARGSATLSPGRGARESIGLPVSTGLNSYLHGRKLESPTAGCATDSPTIAAAAITPAAASTATAASSAATAGFVLRLTDSQWTASEVLAVERLNRTRCIGLAHFHESESSGSTRVAIGGKGNRFDGTVLRKQVADLCVSRGEREVTHINLRHDSILSDVPLGHLLNGEKTPHDLIRRPCRFSEGKFNLSRRTHRGSQTIFGDSQPMPPKKMAFE